MATPYYGWYDDYYYPGTGIYVYDSYRRPRTWNDDQRALLDQPAARGDDVRQRRTTSSTNWSGFNRRPASIDRRNDSGRRPAADAAQQR